MSSKFIHLSMTLEVIKIDINAGQTCFQSKTNNVSPRHIMNSASQRTKNLDAKYFHASLVEKTRELIFTDPSEFDYRFFHSTLLTKN